MSRLQIDLLTTTTSGTGQVDVIEAAAVTVYARNTDGTQGSAATVFQNPNPSNSTALTQPLVSDSNGRIPGWLDPGDYYVSVSATGYNPYSISYTVPSAGGGGGNVSVRAFPFLYSTPGLTSGATMYTPTVNEILLDVWFEIDTAWNGTTPKADVGQFVGTNFGWFEGTFKGYAIDLTNADVGQDFGAPSLLVQDSVNASFGPNALSLAILAGAGVSTNTPKVVPSKFQTTDPVKVVVSTDGTAFSSAPGATQGAATLYLVTATLS